MKDREVDRDGGLGVRLRGRDGKREGREGG